MKNTLQDTQLGSRLREERKRLNLNQTQLAEVAGISLSSQSHYESGTHRPDSAYLSQAARAGIDILYVLTGTHQGEFNPDTIDWLAVIEIADLIAAWAMQRPEPPSPELRAHFLRVFYQQYVAQKKITPDDYLTTLAHIA
ncbi:helix-turn-helix transcriptional regulator [Metallibacterium sp.]|uniref:helix-turn-helix domain-containing protein n=1 Tax=Metallibacterium sp. TaxID=2940281 RepID=UPI0026062E24|nr:helix-turn-helix transcriptional regulator [Metallibacterium sp.]